MINCTDPAAIVCSDLAPSMTALGVVLHEEATLNLLVADLSRQV
ncbi:hypothetical protein [Streptomyces sp. NPDC088146]